MSKEKPDILVLAWPYGLALGLNLFFLFTIKRLGIKVLIREIPFKVPILSKALQPFKMGELDVDENRGFNDSPPVKNVGDWCKFIIATTSRILYYNLADGFLCYHEGGLNIISSYGIKRNKIFPILNSSDTSQLRAWRQELVGNQIKTHPYRIIHVGRLVKWKKVDLLLYAFQQVLAALPGAELVVIGTGPEEENLKLLTRDLGLDKSVHFKGGVYDPKQLAEELFISQVYVLAGMGGLSINDAMAMGKPVICSVCDGTERHLLRDGLNGFFFEENNVQDLAHKIKVILQSPQLCLKMGENSARIIEEEVNEKVAIKQYIQAFESTLA
ncbi:MAG: glycosyltransferase family 4 protein [Cytophagales bacterium]|nr:glycosyltransferase family 4 protein [Cytophagales bacterium]